jgi:hypothetical protein
MKSRGHPEPLVGERLGTITVAEQSDEAKRRRDEVSIQPSADMVVS